MFPSEILYVLVEKYRWWNVWSPASAAASCRLYEKWLHRDFSLVWPLINNKTQTHTYSINAIINTNEEFKYPNRERDENVKNDKPNDLVSGIFDLLALEIILAFSFSSTFQLLLDSRKHCKTYHLSCDPFLIDTCIINTKSFLDRKKKKKSQSRFLVQLFRR